MLAAVTMNTIYYTDCILFDCPAGGVRWELAKYCWVTWAASWGKQKAALQVYSSDRLQEEFLEVSSSFQTSGYNIQTTVTRKM